MCFHRAASLLDHADFLGQIPQELAQQLHPEPRDGFVIPLPSMMGDETLQSYAHAAERLIGRQRTQIPARHRQMASVGELLQGKGAAFDFFAPKRRRVWKGRSIAQTARSATSWKCSKAAPLPCRSSPTLAI